MAGRGQLGRGGWEEPVQCTRPWLSPPELELHVFVGAWISECCHGGCICLALMTFAHAGIREASLSLRKEGDGGGRRSSGNNENAAM